MATTASELSPTPKAKEVAIRRWQEMFEVFVCSEAGKPVYHFNKQRDDEFVVTLTALITAIINFYIDSEKDLLKSIRTENGLQISFSVKTPLIIVVVTPIYAPIDPNLVVNQVYAKIVSILTAKTLKSVFEQRSTYDLRRLLGNSEKLLDVLIDQGLLGNPLCARRRQQHPRQPFVVQGYLTSSSGRPPPAAPQAPANSSVCYFKKRNHGNRALIRTMPLNYNLRETLNSTIASAIQSIPGHSVLFSVLFEVRVRRLVSIGPGEENQFLLENSTEENASIGSPRSQLITVVNCSPKQSRMNPLDVQLLESLVLASESQLGAAESLWLPVCLPRVDTDAFMHGHISYLSPKATEDDRRLCLAVLTIAHDDFSRCQQIRDSVAERLTRLVLAPADFPDLGCGQVQGFVYHSAKPLSLWYRVFPHLPLTAFSTLLSYAGNRMIQSGLKLLFLSSDKHKIALLGWRTPSFSLFVQFDAAIGLGDVIAGASHIVKWVRLQESKIQLKDYS